jgi:hypothetical protein
MRLSQKENRCRRTLWIARKAPAARGFSFGARNRRIDTPERWYRRSGASAAFMKLVARPAPAAILPRPGPARQSDQVIDYGNLLEGNPRVGFEERAQELVDRLAFGQGLEPGFLERGVIDNDGTMVRLGISVLRVVGVARDVEQLDDARRPIVARPAGRYLPSKIRREADGAGARQRSLRRTGARVRELIHVRISRPRQRHYRHAFLDFSLHLDRVRAAEGLLERGIFAGELIQ